MALMNLLAADRIELDLRGRTKNDVLAELVDLLDRAGRLHDRDAFLEAVLAREASGSTGLEAGVALPHARSDSVAEAAIAFGISREGIEFEALDGQPSQIFLLIAEPAQVEGEHLDVLAAASCHLIEPEFRERLLAVDSPQAVLALFAEAEGVELLAEPRETDGRIVAVTSCPVGIAHTYMAAQRLTEAARELRLEFKVETHGSVGVQDRLTAEDIQRADAVILAVDRHMERGRFLGKRLLQVPVAEGIRHPRRLLLQALQLPHPAEEGAVAPAVAAPDMGGWAGLYRHLMNGVSSMLPFVVGGGILITLSFLLGVDAADPDSGSFHPLAKMLMALGGPMGAFGLMVPVLAGFIGRSIAGRSGMMPAMVGGLIAAQGGAGFLGGMVAGLVGGYGMLLVRRLLRPVPQALDAIRSTLLYPVLGLLLCGIPMYLLVEPMTAVNVALVQWLSGLDMGNRVALGALLGALMAVDIGGPINKGAYAFGIAAIEAGYYLPQAAVMAGGMVPPLGLGIATWLFASRFNTIERQSGRACLVMGASFITEGAIPYAAADPLRVIPACILGSALAGALSMAFACELLAPHGGVFVIPLVRNWPGYIVAIVAGSLLTAVAVGLLKYWRSPAS